MFSNGGEPEISVTLGILYYTQKIKGRFWSQAANIW